MRKLGKYSAAAALGVGALVGGLVLFTYRMARRVQAALPPTGDFVDVPGGTLHVREFGEGPPVLLLHGLGGQMGTYIYGVAERLATQYRVVVVDRPGSGYSTRPDTTSAALSQQVTMLVALLDQLQLERPLVVGHSLGGAVALLLALEHPERVAGLALVAPLTHLPRQVPAAFKALTIASPKVRQLFAWTLAAPASILRREQVLAQLFGPEAVPADYSLRGGGLLSLRPSHYLATSADLQALPADLQRLAARYHALRMPLQVLFGANDRILDPQDNGRALVEQVPGATLQLVPGGHMLPVTQPALTANFIHQVASQLKDWR